MRCLELFRFYNDSYFGSFPSILTGEGGNTMDSQRQLGNRYEIPILECRFWLEFESPFEPKPFIETTFRGGLGYTLKRLTCGSIQKPCGECLLRGACAYNYLFETEPRNGSEMMRNKSRSASLCCSARMAGSEKIASSSFPRP
jgi:hypothetical protein